MKKSKIICIGAAHIDYTFYPMNQLIEKTSNPISSHMRYGGVVRNVAENLSRLGINIHLISLVGDDVLGNQLCLEMNSFMNVDHVDHIEGKSTGQYYAVMNVKGDMDIAYADMSIYEQMNQDWIDQKAHLLSSCDIIIADMNIQKDGIESIIKIARDKHITLFLVGVSEPKMSNLPHDLNGVNYLICNMGEAIKFFDINSVEIEKLSDLWMASGVNHVVMTQGQKDVLYISQHMSTMHVEVKQLIENQMLNTTGAGDAFSAGFIFGVLNDYSIKASIHLGNTNARLTIGSQDAVKQDLTKDILLKEAQMNE